MEANTGRYPARRRPDTSSVLSVSLALPAFLGGLVVVGAVGAAALPALPWLVAALWVGSGALLFVPGVEALLCRTLFRLRQPDAAESSALSVPWRSVCQVAGVGPNRFVLLVSDSDQLNAFAAGGRTVAITAAAVRLPPRQLEAVLAHELGHHLSWHPTVALLSWWYSLPARGVTYLAALLLRFVVAVGHAFAGGAGALASLLLGLVVLTTFAFVSFWLLVIPLTAPLLAWTSRLGEFHADRTAARLGYGPPLVDVLRRWIHLDGRRAGTALARLLATHPAYAERINRLVR